MVKLGGWWCGAVRTEVCLGLGEKGLRGHIMAKGGVRGMRAGELILVSPTFLLPPKWVVAGNVGRQQEVTFSC